MLFHCACFHISAATVTKEPSQFPVRRSTPVLFRNNSMPDLQASQPTPQNYAHPSPKTHAYPSPKTPKTNPPRRPSLTSPSHSPKRDPLMRQSSSSFMSHPSPAQMVMAATTGIPQAVSLLESQQMIANSAAHLSSQINLKAVKNR